MSPSLLMLMAPAHAARAQTLVARADALAATLASLPGVRPGAVVEIPVDPGPSPDGPWEVLAWIEAAWRAGLMPVPARVTTPRVVPGVDAADLPGAVLGLRTSGSTGTPRLPAFTFEALSLAARRIARYLGFTPADRVAVLQPLEHGFALIGQALAALAGGAELVGCPSPFPDERARAVAERRATIVAAVPHTLLQLAEHLAGTDAAAHLRCVGSAGGPLGPAAARRLALAFPRATIWNQYGCTEAGPRLTAVPSTHPSFYTGTVGRAIDGVRLWIRREDGQRAAVGEPGEVVFEAATAMLGYLGDPGATAAQRRTVRGGDEGAEVLVGYATGDVGVVDAEDRLHLLGRTDDLVKYRGERVSLETLSRAAEAAGARAAFAVLVAAHPEAADGVLTLVYERPEGPLAPEALLGKVPHGMAPRRLVRVEALPRLPSGKLDRAALEALAEEAVQRGGGVAGGKVLR